MAAARKHGFALVELPSALATIAAVLAALVVAGAYFWTRAGIQGRDFEGQEFGTAAW